MTKLLRYCPSILNGTGDIFAAMPELVAWILERLEADPTKTRAGLAAALGVDKSAITRMLKGERQIKADEIAKIAAYFGEWPPIGLAEDQKEFVGADGALAPAPVYAVEKADGGRWALCRHLAPIDERPRAPHFARAAQAFGFYAPDDLMAPRFKKGEVVWVDPARPVKPGDDVLLLQNGHGARAGAPEPFILAELLRASGDEIIYTQHKDENERRVSARNWTPLHVLARY